MRRYAMNTGRLPRDGHLVRAVLSAGACLVLLSSALLLGPASRGAASDAGAPTVVLYSEDFDTGQSEGWSLGSKWAVEPDVDGGYVLHGTGGSATYTREAWGDFFLSFRLKVDGGALSLLFRRSGCLQYRVAVTPADAEVSLNKNSECGPQSELARAGNQTFSVDTWYRLQVSANGGQITVAVDGRPVLAVTDPSPLVFGGITIEANGSAASCAVDDILLEGAAASPSGVAWVRTGGPPGGMGYDVRIDRQNPSTVYVTCAFAGLHKSVDGGESWVPMNEGIMSHAGSSGNAVPVFCATIDPRNPAILWVGTLQAKGIYRSTDGGEHWELRVNGVSSFPQDHSPTVRGFAVDPRDSNVVFAALEVQNPETGSSYGQIYRTSDSGEHWSLVLQADNLFRRIEIDPENPDTIYAGTGIFDRQGAFEGVFKSIDGGLTWAKSNDGLTNLIAPYLALDPADSSIIYVATGREAGFGGRDDGGVYASEDGGAHWRKILTPCYGVVGAVAVAPSDARRIYAAVEEHFYRSADSGVTWTDLGFNLPGFKMGPPIAIDVHPTDADIVYLNGYGGGIYRSFDGGATWESANKGYTGAHVLDIAADSQDSSRIYATASNCGVFRSDDAGQSYQGILSADARFGVPRVVALDPAGSGTVYTSDGGRNAFFRSCDLGRTWEAIASIGTAFGAVAARHGPSAVVTEILVSPQDRSTIFLGATVGNPLKPGELSREEGLGVYKSMNGGATWQMANVGLSSLQVIALVMDPVDPEVLYVGTFSAGVARTADGGSHWEPINSGLPSLEVRSLAIDPRSPSTIFVGLQGAGVYKSTDAGRQWSWSSAGMDAEASVRAMVFNPSDSREMYAATLSGIYHSTDGGRTWRGFSWGLRNRAVHALAISADGSALYAGTEGEGVYRFDLGGPGGAG